MLIKLLSVLTISFIHISSTELSAEDHKDIITHIKNEEQTIFPEKDIPTYRTVDIGLLGTDSSNAVAINEKGQVLGTFSEGNYSDIFLWDFENGLQIIVPPPGINSCEPKKLNDNGQIVISVTSPNGLYRIFLWDPHCGYWEVDSSKKWIEVLAFNNRGQILLKIEGKLVLYDRLTRIDLIEFLNKQTPEAWEYNCCGSLNNHGTIVFKAYKRVKNQNELEYKLFLWKDEYFSSITPELNKEAEVYIVAFDDEENFILNISNINSSGTFFIDNLNSRRIRCENCSTIKNGFPMNIASLPGKMKKDKGGNLYLSSGVSIELLIKTEFPYTTQSRYICDQNSTGYVVGNMQTYFGSTHAFFAIPYD